MSESYRQLRVWQEAVALARDVFRVVDRWPGAYAALASQLRGASRSVHAAIAEGNGLSSRRDYLRLLHTARGSLQELESDVAALRGTTLLPAPDAAVIDRRITHVGRLLAALIRALKRPPP